MIPLQLRGWMRGLLTLLAFSVSSCAKLKFDNPYDPQNRPPGPQAFSPADGAIITDNPPQLSWASCGVDSAYYHLQISTDSLFSSMVFEDNTLHGISVGLSSALPYGQLNWRVRAAKAKDAWGSWSSVHSFFCKYGPVFHSPEMGFDVCIEANRLYTAYNGFRIWDMTDPARPQVLGSYPEQGECRIAASAGYTYLAWSSTTKPFQVIDVSNPFLPILAGSKNLSAFIYAISVVGNVGYVWGLEPAPVPYTLYVLDLSDKHNPGIQGRWSGEGFISSDSRIDLQVKGVICYTSTEDTLYVIDCQDPTSPRLVRALSNSGGFLALEGERLYTLSRYGLGIYDLTDPLFPNLISHSDLNWEAFDVRQSIVYSLDNYTLLRMADYSNPSSPTSLGSVRCSGYRIAVSGDYAYLVGSSGLTVVRVR
jgi:hypothetical protein